MYFLTLRTVLANQIQTYNKDLKSEIILSLFAR